MRTVSLGIQGEWLTNHVRCLWAEEACAKAMDLLFAGFPDMSEEDRIAICTGKLKLVGNDELRLEKDNTTQSTHRMPLLTPIQMLIKAQADIETKKKEFNDFVREVNEAREREEDERDEFGEDHAELSAIAKESERVNREATRRLQASNPMFAAMQNDPRIKAAQEAILNPPTEKPVQDKALVGKNGWIRPDGAFFACGFMGHINLADRLGSTEGKMEKTWVKVQDSKDSNALVSRLGMSDFSLPERGVTQAQFNTMDKWCSKHGRKLPRNIEVK